MKNRVSCIEEKLKENALSEGIKDFIIDVPYQGFCDLFYLIVSSLIHANIAEKIITNAVNKFGEFYERNNVKRFKVIDSNMPGRYDNSINQFISYILDEIIKFSGITDEEQSEIADSVTLLITSLTEETYIEDSVIQSL